MTRYYDPYQDLFHYFDPQGKEYTQLQFSEILVKRFPPKYTGDYITASQGEETMILKEGWRKERRGIAPKPPLKDVIGKYLVVGQHSEPRDSKWDKTLRDGRGDWAVKYYTYEEIDEKHWEDMRASIYDEKYTPWGHSCWLIQADGSLKWVGADYDTSD